MVLFIEGIEMRYINRTDLLIVGRNFGMFMVGIGLMCLVPIIFDLVYLECNVYDYLIPSLISVYLGVMLMKALRKYKNSKVRLKHSMLISALSWLWACILCGFILFSVTHISIIDACFESMSALTGSGITIYGDVEILPFSILFFRAFQQWVGGLGIIVMIISILSKPGTLSNRMYTSEAREEKIRPSTKATIKTIIIIYFIYTALGIVLYCLAGMPIFDAVCNTFTTISTGGMSIKNANIGYYNDELIYFITILLMILGAVSFLVHFKLIKSRGTSLIKDLQFQVMISLIAVASLLIYFTSQIVPMDIVFTVISAITTTGASVQSSTVMAGWPPFTIFIIISLMLIGGSGGSTVGALKLIRVIVFFKGTFTVLREIMAPIYSVIGMRLENRKLEPDAVSAAGNYIALYLILILITWSLLCLYGHDPFNSLFFTVSMQGNVGLEIGQISSLMEWPVKFLGIFNMWTGRLEIYPVLIALRAVLEIFRR